MQLNINREVFGAAGLCSIPLVALLGLVVVIPWVFFRILLGVGKDKTAKIKSLLLFLFWVGSQAFVLVTWSGLLMGYGDFFGNFGLLIYNTIVLGWINGWVDGTFEDS